LRDLLLEVLQIEPLAALEFVGETALEWGSGRSVITRLR